MLGALVTQLATSLMGMFPGSAVQTLKGTFKSVLSSTLGSILDAMEPFSSTSNMSASSKQLWGVSRLVLSVSFMAGRCRVILACICTFIVKELATHILV